MNRPIPSSVRGTAGLIFLIAGGAAAGAAFWPEPFGWTIWFAFVPFFHAAAGQAPAAAFLRGWLFGAAVWAAGIYWLPPPLSAFLGVKPAAALAVFACICAWHGLMFAILASVLSFTDAALKRRAGWSAGSALLLASAPAAALLESFFPMLFPVYFAGTQHFHLPLIQIAEITGPAGPAWLIMWFNASLYLLIKAGGGSRRELRTAAAAFCAACALLLTNEIYGLSRMRQIDADSLAAMQQGRYLEASLIQGSVPLEAPSGTVNRAALYLYRGLTREAARRNPSALVIWPESVYGRAAVFSAPDERGGGHGLESGFRTALAGDIPERPALLLGSKAELPDSGGRREPPVRFNAAYAVGPDKSLLGFTLKQRLFPFGEFMPFGRYFPWLYRFSPGTDRLSPGPGPETIAVNGARLGVLICYEDLGSAEAGKLVRKGADVLAAISNDIGFGPGPAARQHLMLSVLRAVETRRALLRAANTGVSAVIDPCGRVTASLPPGKRSFISARVPLSGPPTFYSRHPLLFRALGLGMLAVLAAFAIAAPRFRAPPAGTGTGGGE